jgi:hypothetical protein
MPTGIEESVKGGVQPLSLNLPDRLSRAARTLVYNKYLLDTAVATQGAAMLARDLHDGGYGPHEPMPFLFKVIPFLRVGNNTGESVYALVPTLHTIGCSWKWRGSGLDAKEVSRRREELSNEDALLNGTLNKALYTYIPALGIIAPGEGKNRVDFFREEGIEAIPAKVVVRTYPSADRITIYRVECSGFKDIWAVLDGRWVQKVSNPSWTIPLMEAYGVSVGEQWPRTFPMAKSVVMALFEPHGDTSPLGHPDLGTSAIVDLETIRAIEEYQSEEVRCSMFDLKHIQIDKRIWLVAGASFVLSVIAIGGLPANWLNAQICAGIILGASVGAGCIPFLGEILTTERKHLDSELPLPPQLAPKYRKHTGRRLLG